MMHPAVEAGGTQAPRKRLAIFVPSMRGGGAERVMATLASHFADHGYSVDLLLAQREGPYLEELSPRVNVIDLGSRRVALSLWPLARYLRNQQPFVLLTALSHVNLVGIAARAMSRAKTRLVISERGAPSVASDGGRSSRFLALLKRRLYPRADATIAVSSGLADELVTETGLPPGSVHAILNPVDLDQVRALAAAGGVPHRWFEDGGGPVFLAVGRLTQVKGYDVLLRAFRAVRERVPSRLIILGDGPLREGLLKMTDELDITEDVELVGFQPNPYCWMVHCDAYVLSSYSEGMPNSLIQAMACGARVVSTDCNYGPSEVLENGVWGRLVPVGDAQALADAMVAAVSSGAWPEAAERARDFGVERIAAEYGRVLSLPVGHAA